MQVEAKLNWNRVSEDNFIDGRYSRVHQWMVHDNTEIEVSSSPEVVPVPMSDPSLIDPEEAFVLSIASCHMLFFLSVAARKKLVVNAYTDAPSAKMGKNEKGKTVVLSITLQPKISFQERAPDTGKVREMHQEAHAQCFLANSITTKIFFNII